MDPINKTFNVNLYGKMIGGEIISQTLDSLNHYGPAPGATKNTNQYGPTPGATGNDNNYGTIGANTTTGSNANQYGVTGAKNTGNAMSYDYNFQKSFLSNAYLENGMGALVSSTT